MGRISLRGVSGAARQSAGRVAGRLKPARQGPLVVLIHGLNVPRLVLVPLQAQLAIRYRRRTMNFRFDWFFYDVPALAEKLSRSLARREVKEFDAVTHSMGAIVLRWAMNHHAMPRLRRAVLVAPPNTGAWIADHLSGRMGMFFPVVFGRGGLQMRVGHRGLAARAGLLDGAEVGIIAGGSGTPMGKRNIFSIPGDNDGTVAVEETILPGMKDFVLLNVDHTRLAISPQTALMANLFLEHGVFRPRLKGLSHDPPAATARDGSS